MSEAAYTEIAQDEMLLNSSGVEPEVEDIFPDREEV